MTDEEMNQKMKFIEAHHARFVAEFEKAREIRATDRKRLSKAMRDLNEMVGGLARANKMGREAPARAGQRLTEAQARLDEAQRRTGESLNSLIKVIERRLRGKGGAESPA